MTTSRNPAAAGTAAAAARLTGSPADMAKRLRALIDEGVPKASPRESADARREREAETAAHEAAVAAHRHRLAADFAQARGWELAPSPLAVRELARRSPPGNWHRPPREWLATMFHPAFYRDGRRRAAAMVAHPLAEVVEKDRLAIELWAAERDLVATFPAHPSWQDPSRAVLVVFEPTEPDEAAAGRQQPGSPGVVAMTATASAAGSPARAEPAPPTAPNLDALRPDTQDAAGADQTDDIERQAASDPVRKIDMAAPEGPDAAPQPAPEPDQAEPAPLIAPDLPSMRPVAPLDLAGITPRDLADEEDPDFDVVDPTELLIDETYQRDLSPKSLALIRRIVANWSWSKFKVPTVTRVDGRLHVLDGQHSAIAAACHPGIQAIPVLVAKLPGAADRAAAFVSHATERLPTTIVQVHHAAVQAGDEEAVAIDRVCRAAGIDLVAFPPPRSAYRPRQSIALNAVRRVIDKQGPERATEILSALAAADLAPISADHIRAAEALLTDPDFAADFTPERVTEGFRTLDGKAMVEAKALAVTKQMPIWRGMVAVIYRARKARPKGGRRGEGIAA